MARIDNGMTPSGGSVDNLIFYERGGKHYVRSKPGKPVNPTRTPANMKQKCKWANLIANWKKFGGALKGCFETKRPGQSDYNAFVGVNAQRARVYLSKDEAENYASVAENFVVSMGSLVPPVEVRRVEEWWLSDLCVNLADIAPEQTVGWLSYSLIECNGDRLREGDEIVFTRMTQRADNGNGVPWSDAYCQRFTLDTRSERVLKEVLRVEPDGAMDGFAVRDGVLCAPVRYVPNAYSLSAPPDEASLVAWTRRRRIDGKRWQVTTQSLVGFNRLADRYCTPEAIEEAILSYGPLHSIHHPRIALTPKDLLPPTPRVTLTATVSNPEAGWVDGAGSYEVGAEATMRALPRPGWRFLCWDDGCLEPERRVRMERNETYKAVFINT